MSRAEWVGLAAAVALVAGCGKKSAGPGAGRLTETVTKTGAVMLRVPAGEFVMGSAGGPDDEQPAHRVRVEAFLMDKYEVTQKAFQALMGRNPSKFKAPDRPLEQTSWHAAIQYCNARSLREGLRPCYDPRTLACDYDANGYRLPTEAEWEYACRAGSTGAYSFGDDPAALGRHAWFQANAAKATHPVGQKRPNPWGFHDLHGNVSEWCGDFYAEDTYAASSGAPPPRGPAAGAERVLRGGNFRSSPDACRSAARASEEPGLADVCFGYEAYGFRCVRKAPPAPAASP